MVLDGYFEAFGFRVPFKDSCYQGLFSGSNQFFGVYGSGVS